jgi:hypothetical protein
VGEVVKPVWQPATAQSQRRGLSTATACLSRLWAHLDTAPDRAGLAERRSPIRRVPDGISTPAGSETGAPEAVSRCAPRLFENVPNGRGGESHSGPDGTLAMRHKERQPVGVMASVKAGELNLVEAKEVLGLEHRCTRMGTRAEAMLAIFPAPTRGIRQFTVRWSCPSVSIRGSTPAFGLNYLSALERGRRYIRQTVHARRPAH